MKEATGELSTTVIAIVAIAAVLAIFTALLLPSFRANLRARTYCSSAVNCSECDEQGHRTCQYYSEADDGTLELADDTISCECEADVVR